MELYIDRESNETSEYVLAVEHPLEKKVDKVLIALITELHIVVLNAHAHLDLASPSFGIQEENHFSSEELATFPGHGIIKKGYLYTNDQPGLGIDIDEGQAKSLLNPDEASRPRHFIPDRRADGTMVRP